VLIRPEKHQVALGEEQAQETLSQRIATNLAE
jgi:hypothetical protein